MKLFGRAQEITVEALVTDAAPPPHSMMTVHFGDWVWVVADLGSGPVNIRSVVPLPKDRWLLPGMTVPVTVTADYLDKVSPFEMDFDNVSKIAELVASNDPVVADPRAARARAHAAQQAAPTPVGAPTGVFSRMTSQSWLGNNPTSSFCPRPSLVTDHWSANFDREVAAAPSKPAEPGKVRGVAILTAIRMEMRSISHNLDGSPAVGTDNPGPQRTIRGNNAVLAVSIPGRAPYAVFVEHFKAPRSKPVDLNPTLYPWLPVQVSATDDHDVEIVWDEVPDRMEQVGDLLQSQVDARIAEVQKIRQDAGMPAIDLPTDQPASEQAAQALGDLTVASNLPPEVAEMMRTAGANLASVNKHLPPQLQGAMNDAMRMAAQQMASAQQVGAQPDPAAFAMSPDQVHQQAIAAAAQVAPRIAAMPKSIQAMQVGPLRAGLELMAPETRDACLEIYRKAGVDL